MSCFTHCFFLTHRPTVRCTVVVNRHLDIEPSQEHKAVLLWLFNFSLTWTEWKRNGSCHVTQYKRISVSVSSTGFFMTLSAPPTWQCQTLQISSPPLFFIHFAEVFAAINSQQMKNDICGLKGQASH